jgi:hypothetical protein
MSRQRLWEIVAGERNGILATPLARMGYPSSRTSITSLGPSNTTRPILDHDGSDQGPHLLRDPRASLHVSGPDFLNFAVVAGPVSLAVARETDDDAIEKLFEIHDGLGAATERDGFGEDMLANHRTAVELRVQRIYGQILDR